MLSSPPRRVLIVGAGAREHALATALRDHELVIAPGNGGTARVGRNVAVSATDVPALVALAKREHVDLVVIGPEAPLTLGLVDALEEQGIAAFGPSRAAARLEGSKAFMKEFLGRHAIPTAAFAVFDDAEQAKAHVRAAGRPLVVKADGLCAGKGVVVAADVDEALRAIDDMMVARVFGDAGAVLVIEELLAGEEASFHVVCDGTRFVALAAAQDHKRIFDGDQGPNTGGMGAISPPPGFPVAAQRAALDSFVLPAMREMAARGMPFRGVLFAGLMLTESGPRLIEYNVRLGDPETQVLLPRLATDLLATLCAATNGTLADANTTWLDVTCVAVVMAAAGYPGPTQPGTPITGLAAAASLPHVAIFHAGTDLRGDTLVASGGRVLTVCGTGPNAAAARDAAYRAVDAVGFPGNRHRRDIGARALKETSV